MLRARRRGLFKREYEIYSAGQQTGREWTVRTATGDLTLVKPSA
jgi:hypothetical protein